MSAISKVLQFLWKNKGSIMTGISIAWEYAPKAYDYVKKKFKKDVK